MLLKACEEGLWQQKRKEYEEQGVTFSDNNILHEASLKGNLRLVKSLIECGCNKETEDNSGTTPLMDASLGGHLDIVKYLISVGSDKNAKDKNGYTPLIWGVVWGKLEVVKYLILSLIHI